jgi:hypothetical protein
MRVSPFPKSTKTSAYVGQWGRLRFEGGSITTVLQVIQVKLPQTTEIITIQRMSKCYNVYKIYKSDTKIHKLDTRYTN